MILRVLDDFSKGGFNFLVISAVQQFRIAFDDVFFSRNPEENILLYCVMVPYLNVLLCFDGLLDCLNLPDYTLSSLPTLLLTQPNHLDTYSLSTMKSFSKAAMAQTLS